MNDAQDVAAALRATGFTVVERENASRESMDNAVDEFIHKLKPGDVALFYYSGHGMQINGDNYLAAVDLTAQNEVQAKNRALKASEVLEEMEASGTALNIVVLDACRDNPFGGARSIGGQALAPMNAGKGTLLAYATAPGRTADDNGQSRNGLYTTFLLQAMWEPGLAVEQVFKRAGEKVQEASSGKQVPWISSSVSGEFYFLAAGNAPAPAVTAARSPELEASETARNSGSAAALQSFLSEFPQSQYAPAARVKLAASKPTDGGVTVVPDSSKVSEPGRGSSKLVPDIVRILSFNQALNVSRSRTGREESNAEIKNCVLEVHYEGFLDGGTSHSNLDERLTATLPLGAMDSKRVKIAKMSNRQFLEGHAITGKPFEDKMDLWGDGSWKKLQVGEESQFRVPFDSKVPANQALEVLLDAVNACQGH